MAAVVVAASLECDFAMLGHGRFTIFDKEDSERLSGYAWSFSKRGYAERVTWKNRHIAMHRLISGASPGQKVDHANRITLDNRKGNLRFATSSQNLGNAKKRKDGLHSAFKGVTFDKRDKRWMAQGVADKLPGQKRGKMLCLGKFGDEKQAALAYNEYAKKKFGEFASLNYL